MMKTQIVIENHLCADLLNRIDSPQIILLIDGGLKHLYQTHIEQLRQYPGVDAIFYLPSGERCKEFRVYEDFCSRLLEFGIHRRTHLVAMGGGATSDLVGFLAATLLRGLNWSVLPTTLLAMVDAALGGKVGINTSIGKNLIGQFHFPGFVFLWTSFLKTLPNLEYQSGLGEILKYAFLSKDIYQLLIEEKPIEDIISSCANFKMEVVCRDEREYGERKKLNLGHTLGHAFEKYFKIPHGIAVYWGIVAILEIFEKKALLKEFLELAERYELKNNLCPWERENVNWDEIFIFLSKDKKKISNESIYLIIPENWGDCHMVEISIDDLKKKAMEYLGC